MYQSFSGNLTGAPGLKMKIGEALLSGCTITGGAGGATSGGNLCTTTPGPGGAGIEFETTGTIYSVETTAVGGYLDLDLFCPGVTGPVGPPIAGTGTILPLPGFYRELVANNPVRGGETVTFDVAGQPGEVPLVMISTDHQPVMLPTYAGSLLVGHPLADLFVLPALPASGLGQLSFAVPNVGVSTGALSFYGQACFLDALGGVWLGSGTTVTLLDSSF